MSWSWTLHAASRIRRAVGPSGSLEFSRACGCMPTTSRDTSRSISRRTRTSRARRSGCSTQARCSPSSRTRRAGGELGARVLIAESRSQICADGVHFERSTCYHRYTVETYQQFLLLAARNGVTVPADLGDRVRRMVDFLLAVRRPDGGLPEIGDADGGRLLPVVERGQCDPRGVFARGAAMFGRGDLAGLPDGMTPEVPWLMGAEGVRAFAAATPSKPAGVLSRMFPSGGYAVMRTGVGARCAPDDRRCRPARMLVQRRPRPCRSAQRPVLGVWRARARRCGHLLLHAGNGMAQLFPRHGGAQHGDDRRPRPGRAGRPVRLARTSARRTCASGAATPSAILSTPATTATPAIDASPPRAVREAGLLGRCRRCDSRPDDRHDEHRPSSNRSRISVRADVGVARCAIDGRGRRRRPATRSGSGRSVRPRCSLRVKTRRAGADSRMGVERLRPAHAGAAAGYAAKAPLPWRSITLLMPQRGDRSSVAGRLGAVRRPQSADWHRARGSPRVGLRRRHRTSLDQ